MDVHQNARATPYSRAELVKRVSRGERPAAVAAGLGVCEKTVRKWVGRFTREGPAGLAHRVPSRITGTHQKRSPGASFEVDHVSSDDHSRLAYAEVLLNT
jgi:transposase-like protein